MRKIYTIIKWIKLGYSFYPECEYGYHSIVCSFFDRMSANEWIKKEIGAKYENGHYIKGDYLYTVKQQNLMN